MRKADRLNYVKAGDLIPHDQWNIMVEILKSLDFTGPYILETESGWHQRDIRAEVAAIALVIISNIPDDPTNVLRGFFVSIDEDGDFSFDDTGTPEDFQTEPNLSNLYYHYALYDPNDDYAEILPAYKPTGANKWIVMQRLRWPVLTGIPSGVPSQCQIALHGGQYG